MKVCGFCRDSEFPARRWVPRHDGKACMDCGVMYGGNDYTEGSRRVSNRKWYLERYLSDDNGWDRWKMIPYGCLVVVEKWSKVE